MDFLSGRNPYNTPVFIPLYNKRVNTTQIPLVSSAKVQIDEMSESWVSVTSHCGLHSAYGDRHFKMVRWGDLKLS